MALPGEAVVPRNIFGAKDTFRKNKVLFASALRTALIGRYEAMLVVDCNWNKQNTGNLSPRYLVLFILSIVTHLRLLLLFEWFSEPINAPFMPLLAINAANLPHPQKAFAYAAL